MNFTEFVVIDFRLKAYVLSYLIIVLKFCSNLRTATDISKNLGLSIYSNLWFEHHTSKLIQSLFYSHKTCFQFSPMLKFIIY